MKDLYQVSCKIVLRNRRGEVLAVRALDDGSWASYYELPGGRIEVREFRVPFEKIIRREVREEIGPVRFRLNPKLVGVGRHLIGARYSSTGVAKHVLILLFEGQYLGGTIRISREHQGYRWIPLSGRTLTRYFKSGILEGLRMYLHHKR